MKPGLKNDVYKTIILLEDSKELVTSISMKTIISFLGGESTQEDIVNNLSKNKLFGKYGNDTFKYLYACVNKCLEELIEENKIYYFEITSKKITRYFYSLRFEDNIKDIDFDYEVYQRIEDDFPSYNFSYNELIGINEKKFIDCLIINYNYIDCNHCLKVDRIYSWIDCFRTIKYILKNNCFDETYSFKFEMRIKAKYKPHYYDLVIENEDYVYLLEFKQKSIDCILDDDIIINKCARENTIYNIYITNDKNIMSYIICTREPYDKEEIIDISLEDCVKQVTLLTPNIFISNYKDNCCLDSLKDIFN